MALVGHEVGRVKSALRHRTLEFHDPSPATKGKQVTTALAYVMASISLPLVLWLAASRGHQNPSPGVLMFGYRRAYVKVMSALICAPVLLAIAIHAVSRHPAGKAEIAIYVAFGTIGTSIYYAAYRYVRSYRVELHASGIAVTVLGRKRDLIFPDILDACLATGSKGLRVIQLRSKSEPKKPLEISEAVADFDTLVDRLRTDLATHGIALQDRDRWGRLS